MTSIQPRVRLSPFNCEHPAPGITVEQSADHLLYIFGIDNNKPATLDAWKTCAEAVLSGWPQGQACLMLHDLHHSGFSAFNTDMQRKFDELFHLRPDLERLVAVVLPAGWDIDRIAELDIKMRDLKAPAGYPVHWEVFTRRDWALWWLMYTYLKRLKTTT